MKTSMKKVKIAVNGSVCNTGFKIACNRCGNRDIIDVDFWSGVKANSTVNPSVVEEIKLQILDKVAWRVPTRAKNIIQAGKIKRNTQESHSHWRPMKGESSWWECVRCQRVVDCNCHSVLSFRV